MDEARRQRRYRLAAEINSKMFAAQRPTPPDKADAAAWVPVVEMDTNKVHWIPKDLHDEYHRLRYSSRTIVGGIT